MESFKKFSKKISIYKIAFLAIFLFSLSLNCFSQSLPEGGTVVDGSAAIINTNPNTVDINIGSDKSIIDWNSYNVAAGKTVNYNRDSSFISLNRVTGADPSSIFGTINAPNGQIFLVNPNGILFGSGSHVNAAGLVASTLDITNENFMKGNYEFFKVAGKNAYVINNGMLSTNKAGGYICLLSQAVENQGEIYALANLGTIALAAGEKITVGLDNNSLISVVIDEAVQSEIIGPDGQRMDSAIKNSGTISANGGKIILTAKVLNEVFDYAINNSGVIQAKALNEHDGVIELAASGAPIINTATGIIEASKEIKIVNATSNIINEGTISVSNPVSGEATIAVTADNGVLINSGSITADGTSTAVDGGQVALLSAMLFQNGLISANAYEGGTAGSVELISQSSTVLGSNSVTSAACPFTVGNGGQILVKSTNGGTDVLSGAVIDVSAGSIQGDAGSFEINAFNQLGFYGVLNGRAPPSYNAANVVFATTLPYDPALTSTYTIIIAGEISAQNISLTSNQGINITGTILSSGTVTLEAQGPIEATGILRAKTLLEHGASFYVSGTAEVESAYLDNLDNAITWGSGNYSGPWYDDDDINIADNAVINMTGDLTFWADHNTGGWGVFSMGPGSSIIGNNNNLTIRSSALSSGSPKNCMLRTISGVATLTLRESDSGSNPTFVQNNAISVANFILNSGTFQSDPTIVFSVSNSFTLPGGTFNRFTGTGSSATPYLIYDIYGLQAMKCHLSSYFKLAKDIDASGTSTWDSNKGFESVGSSSNNFTGSLDGDYHKITGLYINRSSDYVGLFGYLYGAQIQNVGLEGGSITGRNYVGSLAGYISHSSSISKSYSTTNVTGTWARTGHDNPVTVIVGGLVGQVSSSSTISNCYARGNVSGTASTTGSDSDATVYIGGLVGQNYGTIEKSYFAGNISATASTSGSSSHPAIYFGGLVGYNDIGAHYTANFWDKDVSGISRGAGNGSSDPSGMTGKSTADMKTQSTFTNAGWDFTNTWGINASINNGYPCFIWQIPVPTGFAISGIVYLDQGITRITDGANIILVINGNVIGSPVITTNGNYSFANVNYADGSVILVYIDGNVVHGTTVTLTGVAADIIGLNIYGGTLILRHEAAGAITNAILAAAKGGLTDPDIIYSVSSPLNVNGDLLIWAGKTFTPGDDVTAKSLIIESGATFSAGANTNISGNWTNNGGTFNPNGGTVIFNGAGSQQINGTPYTQAFHNLITAGTSALSVGGSTITLDITGDLTIGAGTSLTAPVNEIKVSGNWIQNGTFNHNNASVRFYGDGTTSTISGSIEPSFNNLYIAIGHALNAPAGNMNIAGIFQLNGYGTTFNANGGTVTFNGNSIASGASGDDLTFNNIVITPGSSLTTLDGEIITVTGNWTNNGTFDPKHSTIVFGGTGTSNLYGTTTFYNVDVITGKTLDLNGNVLDLLNNLNNYGTITTSSGDLKIVANTVYSPGLITNSAGNIEVDATGDISVGLVDSIGTVKLITSAGAIIDLNGGLNNISAANVILNALSGIGAGNAIETIANDITLNNAGGDINVDNTTSNGLPVNTTANTTNGNINFNQNGNSSLNFNGSNNNGDIFVDVTGGDLYIGNISATGTSALVDLRATGAIFDGNDTTGPPVVNLNITATSLILSAQDGIGTGNPLETEVSNLSAQTTNGNIEINNTGDLSLVDPAAWGYAIHALNGAVNISTASPLTVNANVIASGDINLSAGETADYPALADRLTINANITSNNGNITLSAGDDIVQNTGTTIQTLLAGKTITLLGGYNDLDAYGNIVQSGSAQILTNNGDVNLTAWGDIRLGYVNAGTGTATLISKYRRIVDNNAAAMNVVANKLILDSALGIGSHPLWGEDALETQVSQLAARVSDTSVNSYNINIKNQGNLTLIDPGTWGYSVKNFGLEGVDSWGYSGTANINIDTTGSLTIASKVTSAAGDVNLTSGSNLILEDSISALHTVSLDINGALFDRHSGYDDIIADKLELKTVNGIATSDSYWNTTLETQVANLAAYNSGSGKIDILNTGNLNIITIGSTVGVYNAGGNIILGTYNNGIYSLSIADDGRVVTNGGNITLFATGDVNVQKVSTDGLSGHPFTGSNIPLNGIVTVTAGGDINDAYDRTGSTGIDKISGDALYDISAKTINLDAGGDIGMGVYGPLELRSSNLSVIAQNIAMYHAGALHFAGFNGQSFRLINSGDLWIEGAIITDGGIIYIAVVDDPNLYIYADMNSHGGDITLSATGSIILGNGINAYNILTGGGNFAAHADSDQDYSGFFNQFFGTNISTSGGEVIITADDVNLNGEIDAGGGNVTLAPSYDQTIALASATGHFKLSNDELNNIYNAALITIGSHDAGNITVNGLNQAGRAIKLVTGANLFRQAGSPSPSPDITVGQLILDVAGNVGTITNGVETFTDSIEGYVGGLAHIIEIGDLNLNVLTCHDAILETWRWNGFPVFPGNIIGNNVGGPNLIADTAILNAADGINLKTQVNELSARTAAPDATGDIVIVNTGALALNDLAGWGYSVKNFGSGNINISTASPITVNADVIANGNITLTANGAADGDITINANVTSNLGDVTLTAAKDIMTNLNSIVHGKYVDVNAVNLIMHNSSIIEGTDTVDIDTTESVSMFDSSIIQANNLVDIDSGDDVTMAHRSKIQSHGDVNITATDVLMYDFTEINADHDVDIDARGEVWVSNSSIHAGNDVFIDAVNNISLGVIDAGNSIHLNTTAGDIVDTNGNDINLTTPNLYMNAYGNIGVSGDRIDTDVSDIWTAIASHGNVLINELDGVNLWNIQALGSMVDIITGGNTYAYYVYAQGNGTLDDAIINLLVTSGNLFIQNSSTVYAHQLSDGNAEVNLIALNGDINVLGGSTVKAIVEGDGSASVNMLAGVSSSSGMIINNWDGDGVTWWDRSYYYIDTFTGVGTINISDNSSVLAQAGSGSATVDMMAANINVHSSLVKAGVIGNGSATVNMLAGNLIETLYVSDYFYGYGSPYYSEYLDAVYSGLGNINIDNNSLILANIGSGSAATINIVGLNIGLSSSIIKANVETYGDAYVNLFAGTSINLITSYNYFRSTGSINIVDGSQVLATVGNSDGSNTAQVNVLSGGAIVDASTVAADLIGQGSAYVNFISAVWPYAHGEITIRNNSLVRASVSSGTAYVYLYGDSVDILSSTIKALSTDAAAVGSNAFVRIYGNGSWGGAVGNISVIDSIINATIAGSGSAEILIRPLGDGTDSLPGDLLIDNSDIIASVAGDGSALVNLVTEQYGYWSGAYLHNNITIRNGSLIKSIVGSGTATVNINGRAITIEDSTVLSSVLADGNASIVMNARGYYTAGLNILRSFIESYVGNDGAALVDLDSAVDINIDSSNITSEVDGNGNATIDIKATLGSINISNLSTLLAKVIGAGNARIMMNAGNAISITDSTIQATDPAPAGALIGLSAVNNITITNSLMEAINTNGPATINVNSTNGSIYINHSDVKATAENGEARVAITAQNNVSITNLSLIEASSKFTVPTGGAYVLIDAATGNVLIDGSSIMTTGPPGTVNGIASIVISAANNLQVLNGSIVKAEVTATGTSSATVDMDAANIEISNSTIQAKVNGNGSSLVDISANTTDLAIDDSTIEALVTGTASGSATVNLYANGNVLIEDPIALTTIRASLVRGTALVNITANNGTVTINDSNVTAEVTGSNTGNIANVNISAGSGISIDPTNIIATVVNGTASVNLTAFSGNINILGSLVKALVTSNGTAQVNINATTGSILLTNSEIDAITSGTATNTANVFMAAGTDISLNNTDVLASVARNGNTTILITANNGDINVINTSNINANVARDGTASITLAANKGASIAGGNINVNASNIAASVTRNGTASVNMNATDSISIDPTNIIASVVNGTAAITLFAGGSISIDASNISALVTGSGNNSLAQIIINANQNVIIRNSSNIAAVANDRDTATVSISATNGNVVINHSDVSASVADGVVIIIFPVPATAAVNINAGQNVRIINGSNVSASANNIDSVSINVTATNGNVKIDNSNVTATANNVSDVDINITAGENVRILNNAVVNAIANNTSAVTITINAANGNVRIDSSSVNATANNVSDVDINIAAGQNVRIINGSNVSASANTVSSVDITITANGDVRINNSIISAMADSVSDVNINITGNQNVSVLNNSNISALGNNISSVAIVITAINGNVSIRNSDISAAASDTASAAITITAGGSITIANAAPATHSILATITGDGLATIIIDADGSLTITNGVIGATVSGTGASTISLNGDAGVVIDPTTITATVGTGLATINITSNGAISIADSVLTATANTGGAIISITGDSITITGSVLTASVTTGDGAALIQISANGNITISDNSTTAVRSLLTASAINGYAVININSSNGNIVITHSDLAANTQSGAAGVVISGNNVQVQESTIQASSANLVNSTDGAYVYIAANIGNVTIANSTITTTGPPSGLSLVIISAADNVLIDPTYITATIPNGIAAIIVTAVNNITIDQSFLTTIVTNDGVAAIVAYSQNGDIKVETSILTSVTGGTGLAGNALISGGVIAVNNSILSAYVNNGLAANILYANDNIYINQSFINAVAGSGIAANAIIGANGNVFINSSMLNAMAFDGIAALNIVYAGNSMFVNDSMFNAYVDYGLAANVLYANNNLMVNESFINAVAGSGIAANALIGANGNVFINRSMINAAALDGRLALNVIYAGDNLMVNESMLNAVEFGSDLGAAANVLIAANGSMMVNKSILNANAYYGLAANVLYANNNLMVNESFINAVAGSGIAANALIGANGNVFINSSMLNAMAFDGIAALNIVYAGNSMFVNDSMFNAYVDYGLAANVLYANNNLMVNESFINAVAGSGIAANALIGANGNVFINSSMLNAMAFDGIAALNIVYAGNSMFVNDSMFNAYVDYGLAANVLYANNNLMVNESFINAVAGSGIAANALIGANGNV
ncbi:MAG: hypothetical protein WDL99_00790, partial [Candidatus Omnitrophota bacterium]